MECETGKNQLNSSFLISFFNIAFWHFPCGIIDISSRIRYCLPLPADPLLTWTLWRFLCCCSYVQPSCLKRVYECVKVVASRLSLRELAEICALPRVILVIYYVGISLIETCEIKIDQRTSENKRVCVFIIPWRNISPLSLSSLHASGQQVQSCPVASCPEALQQAECLFTIFLQLPTVTTQI